MSSRGLLLSSSFALLLLVMPGSLPAAGQPVDAQTPEELQPFLPLLGNWEGTGTVDMPGMPSPSEWTSHSTVRLVLGNKFIQTDMTIRFPGDFPPPMIFRSYYGWDAKQKKIVYYSLGNTGELEHSDQIAWTDAQTLVLFGSKTENGVPTVSRSVTKLDGEAHSFIWEVAEGAAPFKTRISGKNQRTDKVFEISDEQWTAGFMPGFPPPEPMQKIAGMTGEYRMEGEFKMMPGADPMRVTGRETIRSIFGGTALRLDIHGDPMPSMGDFRYEAIAFMQWAPELECYRQFYLNNMGEIAIQETRFVDEHHLVTVNAGLEEGRPEATRGLVELDATGAIAKSSMDRMSAGDAPEQMFRGTYKKAEDAKPVKKGKKLKER